MPAESTFFAIETTTLQETVAQMCAGHNRLEEFLRGLFGDLSALAEELTRHGQWVDSNARTQEAQRSEQEELLSREREALEATFERIQELTNQLGTSGAADVGGNEQLQQVLAGLQEEKASWQNAMAASESQKADLIRIADDLAATRQDLSEAREELRAQRDLLSQVPSSADSHLDSDLSARLEELEQERTAWAQERAVLETELDAVRTRAAELNDTLDDERQRAAGERNGWAEELRQLRQMIQSLADGAVLASASPSPSDAASAESEDAQDPVLDSVMAQFEILQKDLARRRKAKPAPKEKSTAS